MNRFALCSIALLVTLPSVFAQDKVSRPRITGIHHVRIYVTDMAKSRAFYGGILGFPSTDYFCMAPALSCFAVRFFPHPQIIELQQAPSPAPKDWLAELAFSTDNVPRMRDYLAAHGIVTGPISKSAAGPQHFELRDPEGNPISFAGSIPVVTHTRPVFHSIGEQIIHAGFVVNNLKAESHFYEDILGFHLYWRGGFKDDGTDWYELQVPDGDNWIEYMLNIPASADKKELGVQNHFSLGVPDIHAAEAKIKANGAASYDGPEVGRDGKWALDLYDPDATRVELMEFAPVQKPCCNGYTGPHPKP
jgi:catechol 2,3-dioxygenase-like lactoylglutathione lyase family enzyme